MAQGHRERLKQRFLTEGLDGFKQHEVLELLLFFALPRIDTNKIAHELIDRFGSISAVFEAREEDLMAVPSVGTHAATLLRLMPAVSNYYIRSRYSGKTCLMSAQDAGEYAVAMVCERTREIFAIISLDARRNVISFDIVDEGTVNETAVSPRKVAETALRRNANKVILVHNHPSGTLLPSEQDRRLTGTLCDSLERIGVGVVDHIIVAAQRFYSMSETGTMPQ